MAFSVVAILLVLAATDGLFALQEDPPPAQHSTVASHDKIVVCYIGTWAIYRPGPGSFDLEHIDPQLCTHLIYSFAGLSNETYTIRSLDPNVDLEQDYGKGWFKKMTALTGRYQHLKVLLAIGGWNEGSENYSNMAKSPDTRKAFVDSVVDFISMNGFDGLDLDWEFPAKRGGIPEDKENFVTLVKELRQKFDKRGWLLTAALGVGPDTVHAAYDVVTLSQYLDHVHLMTYDYHGGWETVTGHNAPFSSLPVGDKSPQLNVMSTVAMFLQLGAPAEKLVLGLPFYGRSFVLEDRNNTAIGAPVLQTGFQGPYTRENGFLGYNEICELLSGVVPQGEDGFTYDGDGPWTTKLDGHQVPYMYRQSKWIGYDDPRSIALKAAYAAQKGFKGVMIWTIDTDDFRGRCGPITFPLLRAVNYALYEAKMAPSTTTSASFSNLPVSSSSSASTPSSTENPTDASSRASLYSLFISPLSFISLFVCIVLANLGLNSHLS